MVTDATKKLREPVAYILLAFAGLVALASLIRLFVGSEFTSSAGVVQGTVTPPGLTALVILAALVGAVVLVTQFGERTPNARTVVLAALIIAGLNVLLGLITAFAGFAETGDAGLKLVGFIYALGGLALYGAAGLYLFKTFQELPAPARAPKAGQHGQFAGGQAQPGQYGQGGNPQGGQYGAQYGQQGVQGQYGQYSGGAAQGQYGQPEQNQYGAYGAGAAAGGGAGAVGGYAAGQGESQWPQQEQTWNPGEQPQSWPAGGEAEGAATPDVAETQQVQHAWPTDGPSSEQSTQPWSPDAAAQQPWAGQEAGQQQWPQQEQHQWGAEGQQWSGQEQYGQPVPPAQPEWQPAQQQPGEQAWQQEGWQQEGQSWPQGDDAPAEQQAAEQQPHTGSHAVDETRIEPRVEEGPKGDDEETQRGKDGQGWWSQPS